MGKIVLEQSHESIEAEEDSDDSDSNSGRITERKRRNEEENVQRQLLQDSQLGGIRSSFQLAKRQTTVIFDNLNDSSTRRQLDVSDSSSEICIDHQTPVNVSLALEDGRLLTPPSLVLKQSTCHRLQRFPVHHHLLMDSNGLEVLGIHHHLPTQVNSWYPSLNRHG